MRKVLFDMLFILMFTALILTIVREYQNTAHNLSQIDSRLSTIESILGSFDYVPLE